LEQADGPNIPRCECGACRARRIVGEALKGER
jgi:hypothetical protein